MASFPHFHFDLNLSILISYRNKSQWKSLIENIDSSEGMMIETLHGLQQNDYYNIKGRV